MNQYHIALKKIEDLFHVNRNSEKAVQMKAYMKDIAPFLGIEAPKRRALQADFLKELKLLNAADFWELVFKLWDKEEREFHYLALDLLKARPKKMWSEEDVVHLEQLIRSKSWWDTVDFLAAHALGNYFRLFPTKISNLISMWRNDENMWIRRSCLLFQLTYKKETDFDLLKSLIADYQHQKAFFIQKAIGWSLRSYAECYPDLVLDFVNQLQLQGLARREAIRKIV